jgi:hypothetical protein
MFASRACINAWGLQEVRTFERANRFGEIELAPLACDIEQSQGAGDAKASSLRHSETVTLID